jgi:Dihydroorotase and related cyclic amidohydrolases
LTNKITIKNCNIINEGNIFESDLLIENGRISKINSSIEAQGDVIDASGLYLMPGIIDDQVHFREPGLTERGNIKSESLSAIAGGTTSFMDMPNVLPPTLNLDLGKKRYL